MPHATFVSYSKPDKNAADAVVAFLERAGIPCWFAPRDVLPGAKWADSIVKAIDQCRILVVVFSRHANASSHVHREIELAAKRGVPVVPVRIEDVMPQGDLEYFLSSSHWMDAITPPIESHLEVLAAKLKILFEIEAAHPPPIEHIGAATKSSEARISASPPPKYPFGRKWLVWCAMGLLALMSIGAATWMLRISRGTTHLTQSQAASARYQPDASLKADYAAFDEASTRSNSLMFFSAKGPVRFRVWQKQAELGDPVAQYFVGMCPYDGNGVTEDLDEARKMFEQSADQSYPPAMVALGYMHNRGEGGLAQNDEAAVRWFQEAAHRGNPTGLNNLGTMYRDGKGRLAPDPGKALECFKEAAELGNKLAMRNLAGLYANGAGGIPQDPAKASHWYKRAADAGDEVSKGRLILQPLVKAIDAYAGASSNATRADSALNQLSIEVKQLDGLSMEGLLEAVSDFRYTISAERLNKLDEADPGRAILRRNVDRLIELFRQSNRTIRMDALPRFATATADTVIGWQATNEHRRVVAFWRDCYSDLNFTYDTRGDRESMLRQLRAIILSLLSAGNRQEAMRQLDAALALSDAVLTQRPWDWYAKDATRVLCWDVAAALTEIGEQERVQTLLKRGWGINLARFDREDILTRNPVLPLKGRAPPSASEDDKAYFLSFASGVTNKYSGAMKRFTIPVDFAGTKFPFHFYVVRGKRGYTELQDQFRWLSEYRGGVVPQEVEQSFSKLNKIAVENAVDFMELCAYALSTSEAENRTKAANKENVPAEKR